MNIKELDNKVCIINQLMYQRDNSLSVFKTQNLSAASYKKQAECQINEIIGSLFS